MVNMADFYDGLTVQEQEVGWIKFNIPDPENPYDLNGEGVWGWLTPEDKEKWADDSFTGKLKAILLNDPIRYAGQLLCGHQVIIQCHGSERPTLDPEWVAENLTQEDGKMREWVVKYDDEIITTVEAMNRYEAVKEVMMLVNTSGFDLNRFSVEPMEVAV